MARAPDPKTKLALLRAAQEIFIERGVTAPDIDDIVRHAGLSKSVFYLHFESTQAVFKQIVDDWLGQCASLFGSPTDYPDAPDDAHGLLDFCVERDVQIYEFLWQSRVTMKLLRSCQDEYAQLFDDFRADLQKRNREWLDRWRQDGLIRSEVDLELAATIMSGGHEELSVRLLRSPHRPPLEEWVEFAQETFVRAYGTPELVAALESRRRRVTTGVHEVLVQSHSVRT